MSRIGKMPIEIPDNVEVSIEGSSIIVNGPKGELERRLHPEVIVKKDDSTIRVSQYSEQNFHRSLHGLTRTLIDNMIVGVSKGFEKNLEIQGVGYRAIKKGDDLELQVGYSHPVTIKQREGIEIMVPAPNKISVRGADKQLVGQVAAEIRSVRSPEPYKGKGIRYEGEHVRRKVGKTGK